MRPLGNRRCSIDGCRAYGGSRYMDDHESQPHFTCTCGEWVGLRRAHPTHVGWAIRKGGRYPDHQMAAFTPERDRS